jgi:ABC-type multidrug transport system fused ATPase/permease subunit
LLALPLFLFYSKNKLKPALIAMIATLAVLNALVLYPGVAQGFIDMLLTGTTPFYTPSWILLVMIIGLIVVNAQSMVNEVKQRINYAQRNGHSER